MTDTPDQKTLETALILSVFNGARRLWEFADEPEPPTVPDPFDAARTVALARDMLEILMERRAPRDTIASMGQTYEGEIGKFYRRVVGRKDGIRDRADAPGISSPRDETTTLQAIIGLTLTTTPDTVIIDFNRAAWVGRQTLRATGRTDTVEDLALAYEMQFYEGVMDRTGVTERYAAQLKRGGGH